MRIQPLRRKLISRLLCMAALLGATVPALASTTAALDRAVGDLCRKQVVLLGEDSNHGAGRTLEFKVQLVTRLIEECGFSAIAFESQVYDFLDLEESFQRRRATREQLADAIGGLWSTSAEIDPLVTYLFAQGAKGRVKLLGLDPQTGGITQLYTQQRLPAQLAGFLHGTRRAECELDLHRLTNWRYDKQFPYDAATRRRLRTCSTEIRAAIAKQKPTPFSPLADAMATNLARSLELSAGDTFNLRDRAMFENLQWHRSRLPHDTKVIVWCATVHAAKQLAFTGTEREPLGFHVHQAMGERAASVAFSALAGRYGLMGQAPATLTSAAPETLEHRAFADSGSDFGSGTLEAIYLDGDRLSVFGTGPARPLSYGKYHLTDWHAVLDGIVVFREEQPPRKVRALGPQQAKLDPESSRSSRGRD